MMGQNVIVPNIGEGRREGEEKQHSLWEPREKAAWERGAGGETFYGR